MTPSSDRPPTHVEKADVDVDIDAFSPKRRRKRLVRALFGLMVVGLVGTTIFFVYVDFRREQWLHERNARSKQMTDAEKTDLLSETRAARARIRTRYPEWHNAMVKLASGNDAEIPTGPCSEIERTRMGNAFTHVFVPGDEFIRHFGSLHLDLHRFARGDGLIRFGPGSETLDDLEKSIASDSRWHPSELASKQTEVRTMPSWDPKNLDDVQIVLATVWALPSLRGTGHEYNSGELVGTAYYFSWQKRALVCRALVLASSSPRLSFKKRQDPGSELDIDFAARVTEAVRIAFTEKGVLQ